MQQKKLIRLPVIYDCGKRISQKDKWFIEFYVRNPRTQKFERFRKAKGINKFHTLEEREKAAVEMKKYWTDKLRAGWSPFTDETIIYEDNLEYQTYIKNYRKAKSQNGTFRYYASKYLDFISSSVEKSTLSTYRSKFRLFDAWLENKRMSDVDVSCITQPIMVEFMIFIINERELSKVSVDNYRILLLALFDHVRKERKQFPNPVFELPGTKRVNDSAAQPILEEDIPIFKEAILKEDPQLWLAICFEYYCFLRPRKEVRFLKIEDIDFGRSIIRVRENNAKRAGRKVSIPAVFMRLMRNVYQLHTYNRNFYVFGKGGKPGPEHLSINNFGNRFVRIRRNLKMPEMYKMYSWKHTGNIRADQHGVPRRELQQQNGHTTIQTTEIYMKNMQGFRSENIINSFPEI